MERKIRKNPDAADNDCYAINTIQQEEGEQAPPTNFGPHILKSIFFGFLTVLVRNVVPNLSTGWIIKYYIV